MHGASHARSERVFPTALSQADLPGLASSLGNRAFSRLVAQRAAPSSGARACGGSAYLARQSHPGAVSHAPHANGDTSSLPPSLFGREGRLRQADPPNGVYVPAAAGVVVDAESWMGGFLDFHNFTAATPPPASDPIRPRLSSTVRIEGQITTLRAVVNLLVEQSALDARGGHLRSALTRAQAAEYVARYYRETVNPGVAALQVQLADVPTTFHLPALGSRGGVTHDAQGWQLVPLALVLPGTAANRPGLSATIIPLQGTAFADTPGGALRWQSLLGGAQLAYTVPLSSEVAWQVFVQLLGGVGFPHPGQPGVAQRQEAIGTALVFTIPLGQPHNGQPSNWGQLLVTLPQLSASHTHTDFPATRLPGDLFDTLDISAAAVIAWAPRGFGMWF